MMYNSMRNLISGIVFVFMSASSSVLWAAAPVQSTPASAGDAKAVPKAAAAPLAPAPAPAPNTPSTPAVPTAPDTGKPAEPVVTAAVDTEKAAEAPSEPKMTPPLTAARVITGVVLCAEIGAADVGKLDLNESDVDRKKSGNSSAVVIMKLDPRAKLSLYDFVLEISGASYKCAGIAEDDKPFKAMSTAEWLVDTPIPNKHYRLLFFVPPPSGDSQDCNLKWCLDSSVPPVKIKFSNIGEKPFTSAAVVPPDGKLLPPDAGTKTGGRGKSTP